MVLEKKLVYILIWVSDTIRFLQTLKKHIFQTYLSLVAWKSPKQSNASINNSVSLFVRKVDITFSNFFNVFFTQEGSEGSISYLPPVKI